MQWGSGRDMDASGYSCLSDAFEGAKLAGVSLIMKLDFLKLSGIWVAQITLLPGRNMDDSKIQESQFISDC